MQDEFSILAGMRRRKEKRKDLTQRAQRKEHRGHGGLGWPI
jgi:hypothetical protein